jgi:YD repeat-containing protein
MRAAFLALFLLVFASKFSYAACSCAAEWREIVGHGSYNLGYTDGQGRFNLWWDIAPIKFNDWELPVRVNYLAGRPDGPAGPGWYFPLLEGRAVQKSETWIQVDMPGGDGIHLMRKKDGTFGSEDKRYSATFADMVLDIQGPKGVKMKFVKGFIQKLSYKSDNGRDSAVEWRYDAGKLRTIEEEGFGSRFAVEYSQPDGRPSSFLINGRQYPLEYGDVPVPLATEEVVILKGLTPSMVGIFYPDGKQDHFDLALTPEGEMQTKTKDVNAKELEFKWDPKTGRLKTDGSYLYSLINSGDAAAPVVARTNSAGQQEYKFFNREKGVMVTKPLTGFAKKHYLIMAPGKSYLKARKIEELTDKGPKEVMRRSFDESGVLLREVTPSGQTDFTPDEKGRLKEAKRGDEVLWTKQYDEEDRVKEHRVAGRSKTSFKYLPDGRREETVVKARPGTNGVGDDIFDESTKEVLIKDLLNRTVSRTDAKGVRWGYEFTKSGKLETVLRNEGTYKTFGYDDLGRVVSEITYVPGGSRPAITKSLSYVIDGSKTKVTETVSFAKAGDAKVRETVREIFN